MERRDFIRTAGMGAAAALAGCSDWSLSACLATRGRAELSPPNVVLITVDDMDRDSVGAFGCALQGTTPHIDLLAAQGIRFEHAHVNISVCQPCRGVLATGRYSHRNGIEGFSTSSMRIDTLMYTLKNAGYLTGVLSKVIHSSPLARYRWNEIVRYDELGRGRDPALYYEHAVRFITRSQKEGRPFYLMANSDDPHRPFYNPKGRDRRGPPPSRFHGPDEVPVPGFLPDLRRVRWELSWYFNSVRRADDTVGALLRALDDTGVAAHTMVVFISDNGMSFPFAKASCYPQSTRTPWIVRWPGVVAPGRVDGEHFISTIDFMPTVLEAAGLPLPEGMDGASIMPLLQGEKVRGRARVFTQFHHTHAGRAFPMRAVLDKGRCYIFNPWADGCRSFRVEAMTGVSYAAMKEAALQMPEIARRVRMLRFRAVEELYDLTRDPTCSTNRVDDPAYGADTDEMRGALGEWMAKTGDPALECFARGRTLEACEAFVRSLEPV